MADFIAVLVGLGYLAWGISHFTKAFHFSGMTSPVFGTALILFLHTDSVNLSSFILWIFTVAIVWKIIRVIGQAEKPIYILTGLPRKEKNNEQA